MTSYSAESLGMLPGYEWSFATDINDAGDVVGYAVDDDTQTTRAFLWNKDTGMIDLGTLGGLSSRATAVNDRGQVVGESLTTIAWGQPVWHSFLWEDGVMTDLGGPGAVAINNSDQVVWNGAVVVHDIATGATTDLGVLDGWTGSWAVDINDAGQVAGTADYFDEYSYLTTGFLWTPTTPNGSSGHMAAIPGFWGESTTATAINEAGAVAGYASGSYGGGWSPIVYYNYAFIAAPDVAALYIPPGMDTFAYDLNDSGQVVGAAVVPGYSTSVVWEGGTINYLSAGPGVTLDYASDINNAGQILSHGIDSQGQQAFFLLTPVPSLAPVPSLTIDNVSVQEGNSGTATAVFTVTLSPASSETVVVEYATTDGNAQAGSDYSASSGVLTFAPGESIKTIPMTLHSDRLAELTESFFVNLSGATNATIADGQGVGTIMDDEPRISISDVSQSEGRKGRTTLFTFTVTLSAAYDEPVTMSYQTVNATATTSDNDYVTKSGTLTFAPGETTKTITIEVKGDNKKEASETFYLDLFGLSGNAQFTKNRGIGTILNDD
jgi:probable HAF family extracellular repeat protein